MFLSKSQEEDIQKLLCPYCNLKLTSSETHPDYYRCPVYCIRIWFDCSMNYNWSGIRVYCGNSIGLRYYNGALYMEIYDSIHQINVKVFDISDYSLQELKCILESHIISKFLIENKKV